MHKIVELNDRLLDFYFVEFEFEFTGLLSRCEGESCYVAAVGLER